MKNALDSSYAGGDAFLAKFAGDGKLLFSTYIGGSGADEIFAIVVKVDNDVFLAGDTYSSDFGLQRLAEETERLHRRLHRPPQRRRRPLYWLSYIGARPGATRALGVTVDGSGSPYVVGYTSAKNSPTTEHAVQPNFTGGFRDAFLLKLTPDGSAAQYLTYIGGSSTQSGPRMKPPPPRLHGLVYVAGATSVSTDLNSTRPVQDGYKGAQDGWVARLDIEAGKVVSSTFSRGAKSDNLLGIALGPGETSLSSAKAFPRTSASRHPPEDLRRRRRHHPSPTLGTLGWPRH